MTPLSILRCHFRIPPGLVKIGKLIVNAGNGAAISCVDRFHGPMRRRQETVSSGVSVEVQETLGQSHLEFDEPGMPGAKRVLVRRNGGSVERNGSLMLLLPRQDHRKVIPGHGGAGMIVAVSGPKLAHDHSHSPGRLVDAIL
jgi:hypothetical protein